MKKGFTLIELLIAVSIVIMTAAGTAAVFSDYDNIKNNTDINMCESIVLGTINQAKQYCREKQKPGYILFDIINSEIRFYCDGKRVDAFSFPKGIKIKSVNTKLSKIDINSRGITSDAGTITLKDRNGKLYKITVNVGVGYVEIK